VNKLGCSSRLMVILGIFFLALFLTGFVLGPLGSKLLNIQVPPSLQLSKPHVQLPSEAVSHIGEFKITNTLLSSWITILVLFLVFFAATRKMKLVPGRLQSFVEIIIEGMYNFIQGVSGEKNARIFLPIVATIFLYVITNAWLALIPIWGTIGFWEHGKEGPIFVPLLRAANTDINLTLSIALFAFCSIEILGLTKIGPLRYIDGFFNFGQFKDAFVSLFKGKIQPFLSNLAFGFLNIFIGILEILSHFIRIVSFTFRLFGNMTAGEILLMVMTFLIPFIAAVPFYGLETLVGFLQAMIFAGLTLVFGVLAVTPHHEEEHEKIVQPE